MCGAKRIAQHANPGLLSSPVRLRAFPQNVIKRNQAYHQAQFLLNPARFLLNPALTELVTVATNDGAPVDDGSPMGTALALTAANSTPAGGECLSVARYRFLHHTAVSFVSSDIRVFEHSGGCPHRH